MKTAESALVMCLVGLACFIGSQTLGIRKGIASQVSTGAIGERLPADSSASAGGLEPTGDGNGLGEPLSIDADARYGSPDVMVVVAGRTTAAPVAPKELLRRLADGASGTYIEDLIASRDSAIIRWPDRVLRPLRVWIAEDEHLSAWNSDFVSAVRDAFGSWAETGIPVRFTFVVDSATADVHVKFTERFASGISGKTVWSRDNAWWLVSSDIQLGLSHPSGGTVTPPQMRAIAMHEVGHLLGLDHTRAEDNIMSPRIRVRELTEADRATVRLLYSVPAGLVRGE